MAFRCGQKNVSKKIFQIKFYSKKHKKSPMFTKFCQIFKSCIENEKKNTIESYILSKKNICRLNRKLFDAKNSSKENGSAKPKRVLGNW